MSDSPDNIIVHCSSLLKLPTPHNPLVLALEKERPATQTPLTGGFFSAASVANEIATGSAEIKINQQANFDIVSENNLNKTETSLFQKPPYSTESFNVANNKSVLKEASLQRKHSFEIYLCPSTNDKGIKMGNHQSEKKESDNDSPEEQNAACCKPPKRKPKDKSNKRKSARSDDSEFDSKEVYPFDIKSKEENEILEPVELEPFEIVETDDLSFISGAGTSGVILSGNDGKFRISREIILEEREPSEVFVTKNENINNDENTEEGSSSNNKVGDMGVKASSKKKPDTNINSAKDGTLNNRISAKSNEQICKKTHDSPEKEIGPTKETHPDVTKETNPDVSLSTAIKTQTDKSKVIVLSQDMFSKGKAIDEQNTNVAMDKNKPKSKMDNAADISLAADKNELKLKKETDKDVGMTSGQKESKPQKINYKTGDKNEPELEKDSVTEISVAADNVQLLKKDKNKFSAEHKNASKSLIDNIRDIAGSHNEGKLKTDYAKDTYTADRKNEPELIKENVQDKRKINEKIQIKMPAAIPEGKQRLDPITQIDDKLRKRNSETEDTVVYENVNATDVKKLLAQQAPIQTVVPVKYILTQDMFKKESLTEALTKECQNKGLNKEQSFPTTSEGNYDHLKKHNTESETELKQTSLEQIRFQTSENVIKTNNHNISNPTYGFDENDSIISGTHEENIYETLDRNVKFDIENKTHYNKTEFISDENHHTGTAPDISDIDKDSTSSFLPIITRTEVSTSDSNEYLSLNSEDDILRISEEHDDDKHKKSTLTYINDSNNDKLAMAESLYATIAVTSSPSEQDKNQAVSRMVNSIEKDETSGVLSKADSLEVPSRDETVVSSREDTVPPPSPASMNVLMEENEDDEDETIYNNSNDMIDFGDVVCKRLSQLLEEKSFNEDDTGTTNVDQDSIIYFSPREFVGTSTGRYEMQDIENYEDNKEFISEHREKEAVVNENTSESPEVNFGKKTQKTEVERLCIKRNESAETLKRASGDSAKYDVSHSNGSSDDGLPEFFDPDNIYAKSDKEVALEKEGSKQSLSLQDFDDTLVQTTPNSSFVDDLSDVTPTADISREFTALPELAKTEDKSVIQYESTDHATGRRSMTGTESDLDMSEQRTDMSTDSMYADDEAEETMDILFTKTYTEPIEGAEVFLSCTVVNSAYKDESKKREVWLSSDEALEYFEANASEVMSTAFMKAKQEMKDIQLCLQNLRKQMDNFHGSFDEISLPDLPAAADSLSPGYHDNQRKAITD